MNGPTICRRADGSARRTSKPPRSRARGTITVSIALVSSASSSHFGSIAACQLIFFLHFKRLLRLPSDFPRSSGCARQVEQVVLGGCASALSSAV